MAIGIIWDEIWDEAIWDTAIWEQVAAPGADTHTGDISQMLNAHFAEERAESLRDVHVILKETIDAARAERPDVDVNVALRDYLRGSH